MSIPHRFLCSLTLILPIPRRSFGINSSSPSIWKSRNILRLGLPAFCSIRNPSLGFVSLGLSPFDMPPKQLNAQRKQKWQMRPRPEFAQSGDVPAPLDEELVSERLRGLAVVESGSSNVSVSSRHLKNSQMATESPVHAQCAVWKPGSFGTVNEASSEGVGNMTLEKGHAAVPRNTSEMASKLRGTVSLSKIFGGNLLENFIVDNSAFAQAQIRATFYPKFENEKSDQEIRLRMIEMVSRGLATLEVSLKHSGSLFMYAGHHGGAYAKNSFGNIYTAVGVFVLSRMLREAWGTRALEKEAEFNDFLEKNRLCISMELVTAVLGDHGQRPRDDYVVVTAVTELGRGKPKFYSTPEVIAFCRKWRLPTNHVWLFSTRKSVTSFFAAYDALCEEGTATPVCNALDEVADISVPGSKDHVKVQGEILEGLVARIVSHESSRDMEEILRDYPPPPPVDGASSDAASTLREICAANRTDEKQQIKALLQNVGPSFCPDTLDWFGLEDSDSHSRNADRSVLTKFLQAHPTDFSTMKLQEMLRLMREKRFPAAFKCYHNFHKADEVSNNNLFYKMVIHVHSDSAFRRYQREMRHKPALWPLYRGFFVDINLYKANEEVSDFGKSIKRTVGDDDGNVGMAGKDTLADDDANLMIKLKFLTYKLRTFLIRNGLSILFKEGPAAYKAYYLRQMRNWGTSAAKQRELSKMLDEWAVYIRRKYGNRQLSSSIYLSEAEPFLEQFAKRSPQNQRLVGSAGSLVNTEDFLAIIGTEGDEEGDLEREQVTTPVSPAASVKDVVRKDEGLIVFFPGIPGCAKSALCKELLNAPRGLGDDRPVHSLMGDLNKGRYWQKVADECRKKPQSIMLADKNAPNEEVWRQIEDMCRRTRSSGVPVISDSEGTDSNPYSLDALAVFMFRVLQRVNHPGNLDKESSNAGYVLLLFYHLYEGKSRQEFERELIERFGSVVKMPLLKSDRSALPDPVRSILEEGISLYRLHTSQQGRLDSTKGSYAQEWAKWEKQLRVTLFGHADYLSAIQVPFEFAVQQVSDQLRKIAIGEYQPPSTERRKFGSLVFAAVSLPVSEIRSLLGKLAARNSKVEAFLEDKSIENSLKKAHVTLAHKRSHGVAAVANYGIYLHREVPVEFSALLFTDTIAALGAQLGAVDGEIILSKNEWPHLTLWTAEGVGAKEANSLPQLYSVGKATLVDIDPPVTVTGTLEFF